MTPAEIEAVAEAAAKEAVRELFLMLDADIHDPDDVKALKADFRHVRKWRKATETIGETGLKAAISFFVKASLAALVVWAGWKASGH